MEDSSEGVHISVVEPDVDNDNNTISEELSRFSSPSASQSSSCTSITNPFYEGPADIDPPVQSLETIGHRRTSSSSGRRKDSVMSQSRARSASGSGSSSHRRQGSESRTVRTTSILQDSKIEERVIITWDFGYMLTCFGFLQFLQMIITLTTLICLVSAGSQEGGILNLPLSWHFRIMIFILVLTLLVTSTLFFGNITCLITIFGFEWTFFDMVVYSLFAFMYLVGSSLVASAFDFYEKIKTDVSKDTIDQLVTSAIMGYLCMVLNGLTAFLSYRKWKIQYRLYQRRKLIEEDEIDL